MLVSLPMLVRGHAINLKVTSDIVSIVVPNLYKLELGTPRKIERTDAKSFFDCKLRKLFVYLPIEKP